MTKLRPSSSRVLIMATRTHRSMLIERILVVDTPGTTKHTPTCRRSSSSHIRHRIISVARAQRSMRDARDQRRWYERTAGSMIGLRVERSVAVAVVVVAARARAHVVLVILGRRKRRGRSLGTKRSMHSSIVRVGERPCWHERWRSIIRIVGIVLLT